MIVQRQIMHVSGRPVSGVFDVHIDDGVAMPPRVDCFDDVMRCVHCFDPSSHVVMGVFSSDGRFFCSMDCFHQDFFDFHPCPRGAMVVPQGGGDMVPCMGSVVVGDHDRCPQCDHFHAQRGV